MARIEVKGNVGSDPELKFHKGQNGDFGIASFSLAYTPREKDKAGQYTDGETVWFRVSVIGKDSEIATEIKKGDRVLVTGAFKQTTYTNKVGEVKTSLEIKAESFAIVPRSSGAKSKTPTESEWGESWNS
jgi:single-strand DNA-binding protein